MADTLAEYERKDEVEDELSITAPVEPEVNPEIYKDVEPLLYRGFLTLAAEINGVPFVFKSLNHHEFDLLKLYGSVERPTATFWGTILAHGVFVVGGVNILPERERWISKLTDVFNGLPADAVAQLIRYLSEVNRRASVAVYLTEAYAMETVSRYRWLQLRGLDLTSVAVTGVDGTQRLGLNTAQQVWRAINNIEDRNEVQERDWEHAKFVGSCFAGKGLQTVYNHDARRRRQEREDRMTRKDNILRHWVLGEDVQEGVVKGPGVVMHVARTVEELTDQLEKDIRGEKDWHDRVVEEHETRIRAGYAQRQQQLAESLKSSLEQFPERGVVGGGTPERGYTLAEVEERVTRRKQLMAQEIARMRVDEDEEKTSRFMDRWCGDNGEVRSIPEPRPQTVPFRRK